MLVAGWGLDARGEGPASALGPRFALGHGTYPAGCLCSTRVGSAHWEHVGASLVPTVVTEGWPAVVFVRGSPGSSLAPSELLPGTA